MAMQISFQNPSLKNGIKITEHLAVRDEKTNKIIPNKWKKGAARFIQPRGRGEPGDDTVVVWLDSAGKGIFIEEMPT